MNTHAVKVALAKPASRVKFVRNSDGLSRRERRRLGEEHRRAMMAPLSADEKRALEAASLRRRAA